ncbi:hypothetical protein B0H14DRAFT_2678171 [Mycena olivaceomarginata]|nr:hypothetical protein B0H14DRAFT_2678171 [Mycena olivaceomarginata]
MQAAARPALRAFLIDISGTLHVGSTPTTGSNSVCHFGLCSNTSKEATCDVSARLRRLGLSSSRVENGESSEGPREVWTSIGAVGRVMQDAGIGRPYLLLSDSARSELQLDTTRLDRKDDRTPFDAVVVASVLRGSTTRISNTAFRILAREHPNAFAAQPHAVPGVKARVVGKPSRAFFEAVIGDVDAYGCVSGNGAHLGLWRILVRTGKFRPGDETRASPPPDEVVDSFAAFIDSFLSGNVTSES